MRKKIFELAVGSCLFALASCASGPSTVDLMRGHAAQSQSQSDLKNQLVGDRERGEKLLSSGEDRVRRGERDVRSAERDLSRAQDEVARGRAEISEGQGLIQESERRFRESFPGLDIDPGR